MLRILFPIVTGQLVSKLSEALAARPEDYTVAVMVRSKMPKDGSRARRMVIVRDDGGPQDGVIQRHGYGFNVYAETRVIAEQIARMCMALLPTLADGAPIVRVGNLSGPFEIFDEQSDLVIVQGDTLHHYYFTGQVSSRGTDL